VAAIDCGTNSTRLLVVGGDGQALERRMRITRLGQGVDATHTLGRIAIERTVAVLEEFADVMERLGVERARLVATSAVRDADNGDEFLRAASNASGVRAELLSGEEEGRLSYAGATADLLPGSGDDVVVDIGGGSTELIVGREQRVTAVSMQLGCVRLTERYLESDPPSSEQLAAASAAIAAEIERAHRSLRVLAELRHPVRVIGLAGTVSTLSALQQGLVEYDRDRLHHSVLPLEAVSQWVGVLSSETAVARAARPGMVAGREDVIEGGALILERTMTALGASECIVSESDILDGLAASILGNRAAC